MSSDRSIYDEGAYLAKTKESSKPLNYVLNVNAFESCQVCGDKPNITNHAERVSLESDLLGLTRKLTRDPKQKYQKDVKIADNLNYSPAFLCERNLQNPKFLNKENTNQYMDNLKKLSPQQIKPVDSSANMCKLNNYIKNNDITFTNKV